MGNDISVGKGDRRYLASQQGDRFRDYTEAMLARYSRSLTIRVNVYYHQQIQVRQRVEQVFDDLGRLIAERGRNPIFDHLVGFICAVEQGRIAGTKFMRLSSSTGAGLDRELHQNLLCLGLFQAKGEAFLRAVDADEMRG